MPLDVGLHLFRVKPAETPSFRVGMPTPAPDFLTGSSDPTLRTFTGGPGVGTLNERYANTGRGWSLHDPPSIEDALAANPYLNGSLRWLGNRLWSDHGNRFDDGGNSASNLTPGRHLAADRPYSGSNEAYRHHVCTEAVYSCLENSPLGERGLKWRADCQAAEDMCNQLLNYSRTNPSPGPRDTNVIFPHRGYIRIPPGARGEGSYVPPPRYR
jgi:hypothetical protein